jgi:hypothetical protein
MVSDTKKSWNKREAKTAKLGRKHKKARTKAGTPKFPVHLDSKPAAKPAKKK